MTSNATAEFEPQDARPPERVLVLGANGPSGRLVVQQALDRGLTVIAVTRSPDAFPLRGEHLTVIGGDATDPTTMDAAVARCNVVISVIGTAYTWKPVAVYSSTARLVVNAMRRHGQRRLIVVTSMAAPRQIDHGGPLEKTLQKLWRMTFTRTLYDDMVKMEQTVSRSGLDWTIVRPPGLSNDSGTGYTTADTYLAMPAMARADLATMLLDELSDRTWIARTVAVATPGLRLELIKTIRGEVLKR